MNNNDYISKSLEFLGSEKFEKLSSDPTKKFQKTVQSKLLKMKKAFDKKTYNKLYPSSSQPGLFFGMAKVHKLGNSTNVGDLPLRPIISNIGTATYQISKYLAGILAPLTKNEYAVLNSYAFVKDIKRFSVSEDEKLVSFDVKSLFTNVPLDFTINLILDKIYRDKLMHVKLTKDQLRTLLELCTKELHFSFNGDMFKQTDGVAMGSPLGPVLANIFMAELEETLVPTLNGKMKLWRRYVDDTFTIIKSEEIENVLTVLNSFHQEIEFTHVVENNSCLAFLDVNVERFGGDFRTAVYRKETDTSIYIHWKAYAPKIWKIGTLKGLLRRAFLISSEDNALKNEIAHLRNVFININKYPKSVVENTLKTVKRKVQEELRVPNENETLSVDILNQQGMENTEIHHPFISLPYKGHAGEKIMKKLKDGINSILPDNVIPRFTFKGRKLGTYFHIKDKIDQKHRSNLVYGYYPPLEDENIICQYVGETSVRHESRIEGHQGTDKNSSIYKNAQIIGRDVANSDFRILASGYDNRVDRKICEALYIKDYKPPLNERVLSYKLELFN